MIQSSREPEFILEENSERMHRFTVPLKDTKSICLDQVVVELNLLSVELSMSVDILGKIRDSVRVLAQSVEGT